MGENKRDRVKEPQRRRRVHAHPPAVSSWLKFWRLNFLLFLMFVCVGVISWRLSSVQILNRSFFQNEGNNRTIRTVPLEASRGLILDRNGEPLAVSTPLTSIGINLKNTKLDRSEIQALADGLGLNGDVLANRIQNNLSMSRNFIYVKRHLPPADATRVLDLGVPGVESRTEYQRFYPQGEVAAHIVGFSNVDDVGQEGLELVYDEYLKGSPGKRQVVEDGRGNILEEITTLKNAEPGNDLELSIDFRLQNLAYKELKAEFIKRRARSATIVVLDVLSGEVLAMANQPSYNPHKKSNLNDFSLMRNRALTDVFEPGSTVKAFTIAAALESGMYHPDTIIETSPGWMMVNGNEVKDIHDYGSLKLGQVITKSSNIGTSKIAFDIGPEPIRDLLERVGFGRVTGTGFPGERSGVLPSPVKWSKIETATLSYGYGLSATALQLAQAYSVIADRGILKPVSLIKLSGGEVSDLPRQQIVSPELSLQVLDMLSSVVDASRGGSAVEAKVPFYKVAGKTGTAHVVGERGYEEDLHNSLFVGLIPVSKPKLVIVVVINEPKGSEHYGGQVAAPVFSRVAAGAMRILNIIPDDVPLLLSTGGQ